MVITVEIYKQIRKMRLNGMSQRQIAATLHISRNTVKKYWDGDSVPWERKDYSRDASVLTEDVVAFVRRCLDEDSHCKSRKQHHTAKRIYDRLVTECGFIGGETTIRRLVKELREKGQEAFVPLAFPAGDALQIAAASTEDLQPCDLAVVNVDLHLLRAYAARPVCIFHEKHLFYIVCAQFITRGDILQWA